jgi:hypothetical protein
MQTDFSLFLSLSKFKKYIEPSVWDRTLSYILSDDDGIDDGMMTRLKAIAFLSSIAHPSI